MERVILVGKRQRKRVCRMFGVSKGYLSQILHFKKDSMMAREIRTYCIGTLHATMMEEAPSNSPPIVEGAIRIWIHYRYRERGCQEGRQSFPRPDQEFAQRCCESVGSSWRCGSGQMDKRTNGLSDTLKIIETSPKNADCCLYCWFEEFVLEVCAFCRWEL